jgi:hypothetical protein
LWRASIISHGANNTLSKHLEDAEDSVLKWYQETFEIVQKKPRPSSLIIMGELLVARKHTLGALTLIKEKHLLSVQVILRVLIELHLKLHWVMCGLESRTEKNDEEIHLKLQQLDKRRVWDDRKLVRDLDKNRFPQKDQVLEQLNGQIAEYEKRKINKSPDIANICKKLDELGVYRALNDKETWVGMIYAEFYRHCSRAVHSDLGLVRKFVQQVGNKILWSEDIEDDPEQLIKYTLTIAADINRLFQNYYKQKNSSP